jgi:gamma-glutamyltranspeptidase/glutathione hydrolase
VVAAAHGLAAGAGLRALFAGGTAVDAAVAIGAALGIVEPYMSGIGGGGGSMLIYEASTRSVHVLDYLGPAPAAAEASAFSGIDEIDADVRSCTVPSVLAGWFTAHERYGRLDRQTIFAPAIELAERGWPVSAWAESIFRDYAWRLRRHPSIASNALLPDGEPPAAGDVIAQPELARSYRLIASEGAEVLYRGELGRRLVESVRSAGGWLSERDLAEYRPTWCAPLSIDYRGWTVHCPPAPSSGFQYLECLKMLESTDLRSLGHNSADYLHLLLETIKLASADRTRYAGDAAAIPALLSREYAAARNGLIDRGRAAASEGERFVSSKNGMVQPGQPRSSEHTTHFEAADRWGNLVSVTQSNGAPFGSGFVAGDTGMVLNNFNYWTDFDPASPNYLQGGKQQRDMPMSPCIVTRGGALRLGIGTPGSYGILQTTLQMVLNSLDFGMNVQAAIEAPRVRAFERTRVDVEGRIDGDVIRELESRGHDVHPLPDWTWVVGGGHGIGHEREHGVWSGGADPRRDGAAMAF